jgi:secondary thiamine-phosphate synthase enzyme
MRELAVETHREEELIDITPLVRRAVAEAGCSGSACMVFSAHTTAGITINEHADPSVADDILAALGRAVPEDKPWQHLEGNSPAHVKASIVGSSVLIGLEDGELALGTWQGVFFCEFDGPRTRKIWLKILS